MIILIIQKKLKNDTIFKEYKMECEPFMYEDYIYEESIYKFTNS